MIEKTYGWAKSRKGLRILDIQGGHSTVDVPASRLKAEICRVLQEEGFIKEFTTGEETIPAQLHITLKYTNDRSPVLQGLRRVSKPSLRVHVSSDDVFCG